jgi:hypothetical protein
MSYKNTLFLWISLGLFLISSEADAHKYYLGLIDIEQDSKSSELKISVKLFRDDTEKALIESGNPGFRFPAPKAYAEVANPLLKYLNDHLIFFTTKKRLALSLLGYEFEEDAVWFYLKSEPVKRTPRVGMKVDLLCSQYTDQVQLVSFTKNGNRQSLKLTCEDNQTSFEL